MRKGILVLICTLFITILSGCGEKQDLGSDQNKQNRSKLPIAEQANDTATINRSETKSTDSGKIPPVIDHLNTYPFPVPSGWKEVKFEVREYDEGMDWEAVFTFDGDEQEESLAYKEVIEELGYETQTLLNEVFKIGTAELAGVTYHGTFTFDSGDEYSEWGKGQGYAEIVFSEKQ
ncbi:MAG TPA: hypothetical protein IAA29_14890 [Candidatus Paenibacillus intestinavium]|nr:hypothetical protein [Candidatus Paenibacillus intestinavium]